MSSGVGLARLYTGRARWLTRTYQADGVVPVDQCNCPFLLISAFVRSVPGPCDALQRSV